MAYRILIVNTDYGHFLEQLYGRNPTLAASPFDVQQKARMDTFFGVNDFYSGNFKKHGHRAIDLIYNNRFSQYAWAVENGFVRRGLTLQEISSLPDNWLAAVFIAQIKTYKPDVIVNLAMETITSEILNRVKPDVELIIGQHAAPIVDSMRDLSGYDLFVSSIPDYVELFKDKGVPSEYFKLGFESTILQKINRPAKRDIDIAFVGGFMPHHSSGTDLFDYLAKEGFKLAMFGYGKEYLSPAAARYFNGPLFGRDMYEIYGRAKIVLNRHINISGEYANNMRLYEAAGSGALLITDAKKNLNELFVVGKEVDAYSSNRHCAELLRHYLGNPDKLAAVAKAGQQRTLTEHSYFNRMAELSGIIDKYIGQKGKINYDKHSSENDGDCVELTVSDDSALQDLKNLKTIALKKRFGNWKIKFGGLTIYCRDILSFYYASKDIFCNRIYDFESDSASPIVIDGGGHIGLFTLYVKCKYPAARITIFEPEKQSLRLLRKNLAANGIDDVKIVEAGLYKENTKLSFGSDNSDGSSIFAKEKDLSVNVVRLSDYIDSPVDFVKLNIEGAELDVISEISPNLQNIKELVFEYHGFPEIGQNLHKILPILANAGFRYIIHDFDAESGSSTKPPFKLREDTRFFLLVYAKKLFSFAKDNVISVKNCSAVSNKPVILLYHRVLDEPVDYQLLSVSKENFESHLKILSENYRVIRLAELLDEAKNNQFVPNTVALTFDDGYADNLNNALPLLEKYKIPATIFVTSGMTGSGRYFWWDAMEKIFLYSSELPQWLRIEDSCGVIEWDLSTIEKRIETHDEICRLLRQKPVEQIYKIVDQLWFWAGLKEKSAVLRRALNKEELLKLSQSEFIDIGSHTVTHSQLSILTPMRQDFEMSQSAAQLKEIIHKPIDLISYPFGGTDAFNAATKQIAQKCGYSAGITNIQSELYGNIDMFAVPRRLVRNWTGEQFGDWLKFDDRRILEAHSIADRKDKVIKHFSVFPVSSAAKN